VDKIRWGILGAGRIAHRFAEAVASLPDAELAAVGSRAADTAGRFASQHHIPRAHASYEALAADPAVDAVYVATPHPMHMGNSLLCLNAGKAVLCEKPFAVNAAQAQAMADAARAGKVFLMEAMWTRFLPGIARVRALIAEGAIGEPRMLMADFGFRAGLDPKGRLFDPALGGGGLLDVGVYCMSLASMIFGSPNRVTGLAELGSTGVDEQASMALGYPSGQLALLATAVRTNTQHEAWIHGTEGAIKIHRPWYAPTALTLVRPGRADEAIAAPFEGNGFNYEAAEVGACLRAGRLESATMPLDESIAILRAMDSLRAQWGLRYPMEAA
jgi:predicted dehydrogenase